MSVLHAIDRLNPAMVWLLQSPVHWLASPGLMLIRFTGRKSGRQFTTPVGLNAFDNTLIIMVSDAANRQWWRNFRRDNTIDVCVRGKWSSGTACVLGAEEKPYAYWLERCFQRAPFMPKIFGVKYDKKQGLTAQNISTLSDYAVLVKVELNH